ncbi:MAG: hypothetical protein QOF51_1777 [Chloroflexota bacterium]|jgi:hypothetical protein|nr:hypothetical protein [Chloroflexota bacterium]
MSRVTSFRPTIPVAVRRNTVDHLADGQAESRSSVGPNGFTTNYLTTITLVRGHHLQELLGEEECEIVLGTGHVLPGHFYPTTEGGSATTVLLFIPSGT